jgi:hypothetical protein
MPGDSQAAAVTILNRYLHLDAFCDFAAFLESIGYGTSKTYQETWSEPTTRSKIAWLSKSHELLTFHASLSRYGLVHQKVS